MTFITYARTKLLYICHNQKIVIILDKNNQIKIKIEIMEKLKKILKKPFWRAVLWVDMLYLNCGA